MRITSVEYRRLTTGSHYDNTTYGATACVAEGESPSDALEAVKGWVLEQSGETSREQLQADERQVYTLQNEIAALSHERADLENAVNGLREQYTTIRAILGTHGVLVPDAEQVTVYSSMPF